MPELVIPNWSALGEVIQVAEERILICSPYYSNRSINFLVDNLGDVPALQFWTRLNPQDWLSGAIDPRCLLALMDTLIHDGRTVDLSISSRLHAKVYAADYKIALLGSSNFSDGGFSTNIELLLKFVDDEADSILKNIEKNLPQKLNNINLEEFSNWVSTSGPIIENLRKKPDDSPDELSEIQRSLDELFVPPAENPVNPQDYQSMDAFVEWLSRFEYLPGAKMLLARHFNTDGNNLTGHFKQCYFGVLMFLDRNLEIVYYLAEELKTIKEDKIYQPSDDILDKWIEYFENHSSLRGDNYNFSVLRGYLPSSFGGTCYGGGGGISTFKRMLPLVAKYLSEVGGGD